MDAQTAFALVTMIFTIGIFLVATYTVYWVREGTLLNRAILNEETQHHKYIEDRPKRTK